MKILNTCMPPLNLSNVAYTAALADTNVHILTNPRTLLAAILELPGGKRVEQKRFYVRASGTIVSGATANFKIGLYKGTSLTVGSDTLLKASTARAVTGGDTVPWSVEGFLIFDLTSGLLHGATEFMVNDLYDVKAANTAGTGLTDIEPVTSFVIGADASTGNAASIAYMTEFVLGL